MKIELAGRVALVTGGSKGLGFATAARLAEAGADVAILARNAETLEEARRRIEAQGRGRVRAFVCDVARPEQIERAYGEVMAGFGRIDILVNNAGESRRGAFETVSDVDWQADIDQKLFSAIRLTRLVWPQLKERRWGRVINVLSSNAKAPKAEGAPTQVTRAAGLALTKVLAGEGAPHNILVNALLVSAIISDQIARRSRARGVPLDELIRETGAEGPLGRMGTAEEFANVACFLASDAASYVTGTGINVDGGSSPVV